MSSAPCVPQRVDELRHERLVPGGLARHADDVHVVLDRVARGFLGRLEQRADVDVEAEVGERGGDHLGAAVVAVLAELGDEDARAAALVGRRTSSTSLRMRCELLVAVVGAAVHAGDAYGSSARWRPNTSSIASEISPTVARARVASIDSASRLPSPLAPSVERVERRLARGLRRASALHLLRAGRSAGSRTSVLSMSRMSTCRLLGEPVLVDADDRLVAAVDARPGAGPPPPRCAASACPTRRPWSCRRAPRPPR